MAEVTGSRLLGQPAALRLRTRAARAVPPDARTVASGALTVLAAAAAAAPLLQASTCRSDPPGVQDCSGALTRRGAACVNAGCPRGVWDGIS